MAHEEAFDLSDSDLPPYVFYALWLMEHRASHGGLVYGAKEECDLQKARGLSWSFVSVPSSSTVAVDGQGNGTYLLTE